MYKKTNMYRTKGDIRTKKWLVLRIGKWVLKKRQTTCLIEAAKRTYETPAKATALKKIILQKASTKTSEYLMYPKSRVWICVFRRGLGSPVPWFLGSGNSWPTKNHQAASRLCEDSPQPQTPQSKDPPNVFSITHRINGVKWGPYKWPLKWVNGVK